MLVALSLYAGLGAVSAGLAAITRSPELSLALALAAVLFLLTGLPALILFALWIKRKRDHANRLKVWRYQQIMKQFGAEYGAAYSGPPHHWISSLTPAKLEGLAAEIFTRLGYQAKVVGRSGDRGIDVHLTTPTGRVEVVQCKQWGSAVGEPDVRNLYGAMMHAGARQAYLFAPQGLQRQRTISPRANRSSCVKGILSAS